MTDRPQYRVVHLKPLAAGLKSSRSSTLIADGQTPRAQNVRLSRESILNAGGSTKANNQILRRPALRTRIDPSFSPLRVAAGQSAPMRGYGYLGYHAELDIGGDFASSGAFPAETFHERRGRSFERQITVTIPEDFRMYNAEQRGTGAPAPGAENTGIWGGSLSVAGPGYDEGVDDCCLILQKGGDRMAPLQWALGIVNAGRWEANAESSQEKARKSNYFFVFMWLDSAGWGEGDPADMRYDLDDPTLASTGDYSTQALRAVILDGRNDNFLYAVEAGKTYHLSVGLQLDSGDLATAWNHDGAFYFRMREGDGDLREGSFVDSGGGGTTTNLSLWKGPNDSLRYFAKYGVRYSSRDPEYLGLGYRTAPWNAQGFIPFGMDSAAMENKGFRMADRSAQNVDDLYGAGAYTLTCDHPAGGNTYIGLPTCRALTTSNANFKQSPLGPIGGAWLGFGDTTGPDPNTAFNSEALRGYRVVWPGKATVNASFNGGVMTIQTYTEVAAGDYRLALKRIGNTATSWGPTAVPPSAERAFLIQAFRWNQQDLILQELRCWAAPRDYTDPRVQFSMRSSIDMDDELEPDLETLEAVWPLDDAGARTLRELVGGRTGYLAPYGLGLSDRGTRGKSTLFLSGEGEALTLDMSEDPVLRREMQALLASRSRGMAVEMTCIVPEAAYGLAVQGTGARSSEYEAAYAPDLIQVAVKDSDEQPTGEPAAPLLTMGHHSWWGSGLSTLPERRPQGFNVDYHAGADGDTSAMSNSVRGHTRDGGPGPWNWDETTPWVGRTITLQVGIQPSAANRAGTVGFENEFDVYIAGTPKGLLSPVAGEDPSAEFAYFTSQTIQRKDLPRLVVTIGGGWTPSTVRGYTEFGGRLIVDEVRVYGCTAAGELPAVSGDPLTEATGKLLGRNSLPARELEDDEILRPVGPGTVTANVSRGETLVAAHGLVGFYTGLPEDSADAIVERYVIADDMVEIPSRDDIKDLIADFHLVDAVAADGLSLTLATPYAHGSRDGARLRSFALLGYTAISDPTPLLTDGALSLGASAPFDPGATVTADLILSEEILDNPAPVNGKWRVRIASPFAEGGLALLLPVWVAGCVTPRRSPITGIYSLDSAIFASGVGAVALVDDRWREDGPTRSLRTSLQFRGLHKGDLEALLPERLDCLRLPNYTNAWPYWDSATFIDKTWVYDFWLNLDDRSGIRSLMWLGCEQSNMMLGAAASNSKRGIGIWLRLNNGRPEVVRESAGNYSGGSTPPPLGRYVATSASRVTQGWCHVRFYLEHYNDGTFDVLRIPGIAINGRPTSVTVNAVETGLVGATDWIKANNGGGLIGSRGDTRNALFFGCARDAIDTSKAAPITAQGALGGLEVEPARFIGPAHPLGGTMCGVSIWRRDSVDAEVAGFPAFNPRSIDLAGADVRVSLQLQEGDGHLVDDAGSSVEPGYDATPGTIESHPFLERYTELGTSTRRTSWATVQNRVYVTNGGRVAQVSEVAGGPAGILPPSTRPEFLIERPPLWQPNYAPAGSSDVEQDPIAQAAAGAGEQINHYANGGNNYLQQAFHDEMAWEADASAFDVVAGKFYWKPTSVSGRQHLFGAKGGVDSGGVTLESVDGKLRLGWYDSALKESVWVQTNRAMFRPGYWYYIFFRKAFPLQDEQEGNWFNSYFSSTRKRRASFTPGAGTFSIGEIVQNGGGTKHGIVTKVTATHIEYLRYFADADFTAAEAVQNPGGTVTGTIAAAPYHNGGDQLIVREFPKTSTIADQLPWSAKASTSRVSISLTCEFPRPNFTSAVGPVSPKGILYTGATLGGVSCANVQPFTNDMVGMQWQFAGTSYASEPIYRIRTVVSGSAITVEDVFGNTPNLAAIVNREGAVFAGAALEKSERFDESNSPDPSAYPTYFMGSPLARDPSKGIDRLRGEFASFTWGVFAATIDATHFYTDVNPFESAPTATDNTQIGLDAFQYAIDSTVGRPGELKADSGKCFTAVDTQPYAGAAAASTQPNSGLEVAMDTEASESAESLFWGYVSDPVRSIGARKVSVAFYDQGQDQLSQGGPELTITPGEEDDSNPSGGLRLILTALPISHQPGDIQRWVYVSGPDGKTLYRQAIVPDNQASSASMEIDGAGLDTTDVLTYDRSAPPDCGVLASSQGSLCFGDVRMAGRRQADMVRFSKPFLPLEVPQRNAIFLVGGRGEAVTAMAELAGKLLIWKRDAMFEVTFREGAALVRRVSDEVGCAAPQLVQVVDGKAYWWSDDRGPYVYVPGGEPVWLGDNTGDIFEGTNAEVTVDLTALEDAVAAVDRNEDAYVVAFKATQDRSMRRRHSIEYDGGLSGAGVPGNMQAGFRHTLFSEPALTALGSSGRRKSGPRLFLGGTEDGFLVKLNVGERHLDPLFGADTVTLDTGSTTTKFVLATAEPLFAKLEGLRGARLSWINAGGAAREARALFSDGSAIYLDRAADAAPAAGTVVALGQPNCYWETRWLDLGSSEERKNTHYLDVIMEPGGPGTLYVEALTDFNSTPKVVLSSAAQSSAQPMSVAQGYYRIPLGELNCRFLKVRIRNQAGEAAFPFEVTELVVKVEDAQEIP